jgi:hypothetical protein
MTSVVGGAFHKPGPKFGRAMKFLQKKKVDVALAKATPNIGSRESGLNRRIVYLVRIRATLAESAPPPQKLTIGFTQHITIVA